MALPFAYELTAPEEGALHGPPKWFLAVFVIHLDTDSKRQLFRFLLSLNLE
ncbi:MAG: hypothetical protein VX757_00460 [Planctomycetota bacterium]|nr:hypothetical protein [Planctomycetota bacterium]